MTDQRDLTNHVSVTYHGEIHPDTYKRLVYSLHVLNRDHGITFNLRCKARTKETSDG